MNQIFEVSDDIINKVIYSLNALLADEYVLCCKTRDAHKNIKGKNAFELQKTFEMQSSILDSILDEVYKKIHSFGYDSIGTHKYFIGISRISEKNLSFKNPKQVLQSLLKDHELLLGILENEGFTLSDIDELHVSDFLSNILKQHEKMAWTLKACLSQSIYQENNFF